ncbi:MAG: transporter [Rhodanobacter sp. SCN 65-17]|jgi:ZIP family zinc transporter|uniref:ZIP family metal transporter n=1 Tax=Rhodanobacter sp. PCA2 TaxID=2006117 RepID=UPI00086C0453|nr:ZIP family metal transporter [Rhodanobacter sp. PCA2]MBA2079440.1 transporter [Rhodanobacter sp. PCA2]ODU66820.1 MAG: transporter [Rhodanobacter sp. SCN 65-17]
MLGTVLLYALAPLLAMGTGGLIAAFKPPSPKLGSAVQHFAAGVVFSALAVEILPDILHQDAPLAALAGFTAGVLLMLGLRQAGCRIEKTSSRPWGMTLIVGADVLIDGVLIGVAFGAGTREGLFVTIALAVEMLSLGLATAASLARADASRTRIIVSILVLAILPFAGALAGSLLLGGLKGGWMEAVLAFAAATFLYLVTEELLKEAHEVREAPWMTALFFAGFIGLLLLDMVAPAG